MQTVQTLCINTLCMINAAFVQVVQNCREEVEEARCFTIVVGPKEWSIISLFDIRCPKAF